MFKKLAITAFLLAAFAAAVTRTTMAAFTSVATNPGNAFTAATIGISTSPTSALVTFSGMIPGDSVTNPIVVTNAPGSASLRYAVASSSTNADGKALKDQLALTIKTVDVTTPGTPCDNFDGTQLYTGDVDSTAGKLVGDNAQGAQAGDRTLAPSASETLCFRVNLPTGTANAYQNAATTATFTFDAEQTVNNP